ncbi:transposase [Candidatus Palauibacter sp.]|uniref:transposase n=1 Tax=Candidatus Palauibacter sp. TaxID=3101350 RepID=UPI003AF2C10F
MIVASPWPAAVTNPSRLTVTTDGSPEDHVTAVPATGRPLEARTTAISQSFWATLKRAHNGTYHHLSAKHLRRYVDEFAERPNFCGADTLRRMRHVVARMIGKRLTHRELVEERATARYTASPRQRRSCSSTSGSVGEATARTTSDSRAPR